jgi:hypothetical protein
MTAVTMIRPDAPRTRSPELVLAHAHLRLGSLALARTELETLAGLGKLGPVGLVDLAEVRWRTGDLAGAGEAAGAALQGDEEDPVALVIAAEAAAALGRPNEARRLASRAMAAATGSIDVIFAGMPRSAAWPPDADEPPPTAPTLFDRAPEPPTRGEPNRAGTDHAPAPTESGRTTVGTTPVSPVTRGFWDEDIEAEPGSRDAPDPALELEAGKAAIVAGALDEAALRFGIALRLAPALAPAILEATAGARVPSLIVVRGDAHRVAGHEMEAREAYLVASHGGLPERRKRSRVRPAKSAATTSADPALEDPAEADESEEDASEVEAAEADAPETETETETASEVKTADADAPAETTDEQPG